jgi:hypothetical protein
MVLARSGVVTLGVADLELSVASYRTLRRYHCSSSIDGVIHRFTPVPPALIPAG